jgi:hypothetical protein
VTSPGLPVNIDTTYADDGADASVKAHQIYHDTVHALANEFATAASSPRLAREIWARNDANTLFEPVAGESKHIPLTTFREQTGLTYTFAATDAGQVLRTSTAEVDPITWTIPTNASVAIPVGTAIGILQWGTGQITVVGASGVTLRSAGSANKTAAQYGRVIAEKVFTDTWVLSGALAV